MSFFVRGKAFGKVLPPPQNMDSTHTYVLVEDGNIDALRQLPKMTVHGTREAGRHYKNTVVDLSKKSGTGWAFHLPALASAFISIR